MPVPPLTAEQRTAALEKAAAARRTRAAVAAELRAAPDPGHALQAVVSRARTDEAIGKMRVAALLDALPGIGKIRAAEIMGRLEISPSRRVRGLGSKQLAALEDEFRSR